ncbi:substrate-binding domain-containing protein [Sphingomicrobium lutaoense]|uniref:hypothetical protein n=1 Tax=Sphingomicrobium lutaoense TaxID=515949 RepID=UPI00223F5147|nr:hypothetical protein [Sphingomicrobium lutaoense]
MALLSLASLAASTGFFASLDLCADEYLLLFAPRERIASVSHLVKDEAESPLAPMAKSVAANDGALESLAGRGISIAFTTRPIDPSRRRLAERLGIRLVSLGFARGPGDVADNVRKFASMFSGKAPARDWLGRYRRLAASAPPPRPRHWVSASGAYPGESADGWLRLAGIRLAPFGSGLGRIEQVAAARHPLLLSDYRAGQYSRNAEWLAHPLVKAKIERARKVDGRPFTCAGPLMLDLAEELRRR